MGSGSFLQQSNKKGGSERPERTMTVCDGRIKKGGGKRQLVTVVPCDSQIKKEEARGQRLQWPLATVK